MANVKISELNPLVTVQDADVLPIVDNAITKKVTAAILRSYTQGNSVLLTGAQTIAGIKTFTAQLASTVATGTAPFSVLSTTKVTNLNADLLDGLSSADFQATLSGTGIVKSTAGTISYLTDNSSNWNTAFNDSITSAAVTGTTTKTLTLNQQDGGSVTASWTDDNTDAVSSVFGRTGAVVATEGDYSLTQLSDVTLTSPANGQVLKYNGTAWINGTDLNSGTVTSVGMSVPTGLSVAGSPITTSGTLALSMAAGYSLPTDASQSTWNTAYNDSIVSAGVTGTSTKTLTLNQQDGGMVTASWSDADTGLTSVGLSMPSAFTVSNSPLTSNGTIAVTGAGVASQYVRGDGTLAPFPTSSGGGSSVSYYLNGGTNQGTIGGNTYYEMSKDAVIGVGADFNINANGYIAQFVTDANDPALLSIPGGNWNFEMWFSANSGGGTPSFYLELYKYDGTTLTLISSGSATPESITNGTAIDLYTTALAVPTTALTITDRLAVRVFVNNSGRTITLHTQNGHLCQAITTFSTGLTALNGLTNQVQYFAVGTSGTDFGISSATSTHTFNLPTASATNRGALSSADWTTFNNKASTADLANYLPLAGGTLTGALGINGAALGSTVLTLKESASLSGALAITNRNSNQTYKFAVDSAAVDDGNFCIINNNNASIPFLIAPNGAATFASSVTAGSIISTKNNAAYDAAFIEGANGIAYIGAVGTASDIQLYNGGSTKVTIKPISGNVGIGTTAPLAILDVFQTGQPQLRVRGTAGANHLYQDSITGTSNSDGLFVGIGSDQVGYVFQYEAKDLAFGTNTTERMRITSAGNVQLQQGISLSGATAPASGIEFPATQVASASANNLDDYEEGTWTMGVSFGYVTTGIVYSNNTGTYTKIGRQVTVNGFVALTNKGSSIGSARITGLPFAIANNPSNYSAPSLNFSAITFANQLQGLGEINATTILLEEVSLLGTVTGITDADFANNSYIVISFTYFV